jgi:signal transduction histidine kinase/ligand-binding sensor domain-containing protein
MRFAELAVRGLRALWCVFCLTVCARGLAAQTDFSVRLWQAEDGLPNNIVQAVAQTGDGFLWVGTREGLAQFDGDQFHLVDLVVQSAQPSIACLLAARDGSLWVGTQDFGIFCLNADKLERYDIADGNKNFSVYAIQEGGDGSIWFGTSRGILRWSDHRLERLGAFRARQLKFCADKTGRIWGLDGDLKRMDAPKAASYTVQEGVLPRSARSLYCDTDGVFWIGTDVGEDNCLVRLKDGVATSFRRVDGPAGFVSVIFGDSSGELWIGSYAGLSRFVDGKFVSFQTSEQASYRVYSVIEDREHNLWIGSEEGLARLAPKRFKTFTKADGLSMNTVVSVCPSQDGGVWIGTWGGGLNHYLEGKVTRLNKASGLKSDFVMALTETRDGGLWAGMDYGGGLHRVRNGEVTVYGREQGFVMGSDSATIALYEADDGMLWIGNRDGLQTWNGARFVRFTTKEGLCNNTINAFCGGAEHDIWIGTDNGLMRWHGGNLQNVTGRDPRLRVSILSLYEDAQRTLWVGTGGRGLLSLREGGIGEFTHRDGLFSDAIYSILEDNHTNLWLNSSRGVFRVNKRQLEAVAEGRETLITSVQYGKADGIPASGQYRNVTQPAACKDARGRLWFRTTQGVVMVDPETIAISHQPAPVVIQDIIADNVLVGTGKSGSNSANPIIVSPGRGELEIHYVALSYSVPERNLYRYRLEGADSDWVNAGNIRVAKYNNLRPGRYAFEVIACNSDGIWTSKGPSVSLVLRSHFWQTWSFFFLCVATAIGLVGGTVRSITRRRMQRKLIELEQQHAVDRERSRIARDVHDELGTRLTQISFQGSIAKCSLKDPLEAERQIEQMSASAREAVTSLQEIIWAADPENDSLEGLVGHISQYAEEFLRAAAIACEVVVPEHIPARQIPAVLRHNLFLAVKESLNNAAKHANASRVLIQLFLRPDELEILVSDNGGGFAAGTAQNPAREKPGRTGHGLGNMRERLKSIGGQCEINSEPGQGTTVRFAVPLAAGAP